MECYVMRFSLDFRARIGNRNCQAAIAHDRKVDYVVAHKRRLRRGNPLGAQNALKTCAFVLNALMHMIDFQVTRT